MGSDRTSIEPSSTPFRTCFFSDVLVETIEHIYFDSKWSKTIPEGLEYLLCKNYCRYEQPQPVCHLITALKMARLATSVLPSPSSKRSHRNRFSMDALIQPACNCSGATKTHKDTDNPSCHVWRTHKHPND